MKSGKVFYDNDWVFKTVTRSRVLILLHVFQFALIIYSLGLVATYVALAFVPAITVLAGVIVYVILTALYLFYHYLYLSSIKYVLETTRHVQVGNYFDVRSGNIIVEAGVLFRRTTVYSVECFENCEIKSGVLDYLIGTGQIEVIGRRGNVKLLGIEKPHNYLLLIQDLIDDYKGNFSGLKGVHYSGVGTG